jgi:hypothetical protein
MDTDKCDGIGLAMRIIERSMNAGLAVIEQGLTTLSDTHHTDHIIHTFYDI